MHIRLVPALKAAKSPHDWVLDFSQDCSEGPGAMPLELRSNEFDVLGRVQKAVRGTVQWNKTLAPGHVIQQHLLLLRRNPRRIRIDHQAVVFPERRGV